MANVFDQFDAAPGSQQAPRNVFDQFDTHGDAPAPGYLEAGARGVAQGGTLGLADEIFAAGAGTRSWFKGEGYGTGYDRALADYRGGDKAAEEAHPYVMGGAKIAGGVAATVPAMAVAPAALTGAGLGMAGRIGAGAVSGIGLGAAQGFNEGEGGALNRAGNAFYGGVAGGVVGGAAAPIAAGAGALARAAAPYLPEVAIPGLSRSASREAATAVREAGGAPAVQQRLAELGPEGMLLDAGQPLAGRAAGVAAMPGAPGERVVTRLAARDAGTDARLARGLDDAFGPAPVPSQIQGEFAAKRAAAGTMYEQALGQAGPVDTSAALAEIGARLNTAAGAERAGLLRARELLTAQGETGVMPRSDPRYLHNAKGALDDLIQYGDPTIGIPRGALSKADGSVAAVRGRLNGALEQSVPGYADANLAARTAHRASEAFESGGRVLSTAGEVIHPADFATAFAGQPLERQAALRAGVRADLDRTVGNSANDLSALNRELQRDADWNRLKLGTVYGPEAVEQAARTVDANTAMRGTYRGIVQGSQTAQRTQGAEAMGIRDLMPKGGGSGSGIAAVAAMAGHPEVAVIPMVAKAGKFGLNVAGRASDRTRNEGFADIVTRQGAARDETVQRIADLLAKREGRTAALDQRTALLVQALIGSGDRNSGSAQRARQIGALLAR